jgi:hypothetical protein
MPNAGRAIAAAAEDILESFKRAPEVSEAASAALRLGREALEHTGLISPASVERRSSIAGPSVLSAGQAHDGRVGNSLFRQVLDLARTTLSENN